jgi:formate dehydrogenase maturation protein FdhE
VSDSRVQRISQALAEAENQDEQLNTYYEFQRMLFQMLNRAKVAVSATLEMVDEEALAIRVDQGLPLVSFNQLPLKVKEKEFAELVSRVAQLLVDYDPDLAEQDVPENATECLALAERRFEENQARGEPLQETAEPSLKQMAVDLALKPYLEWAAEEVLRHLERERWKQGYCPVCGGAPDFAALDAETGSRRLLCSRCSSEWSYPRMKCPFCGTTDHTKIFYYPGEKGVYRLYACRECMRYLKTIDLREVEGDVLLPVERITTIAMDAAARSEGYT